MRRASRILEVKRRAEGAIEPRRRALLLGAGGGANWAGSGLHEEPSEKVEDRSVENLRLVQICRVPSVRNDDFLRAGDFGGHVARGREEGRIVGADDDER